MDDLEAIKQDTEDLIGVLKALRTELDTVEAKRKALENVEKTLAEREKMLNDALISNQAKKKELDEQEGFIAKQTENVKLTLAKIEFEKRSLISLKAKIADIEIEKQEIAKQKEELTKREEALHNLESEHDAIGKERLLMQQQREKEAARTALLDEREKRIQEKETRIEQIEDIVRV